MEIIFWRHYALKGAGDFLDTLYQQTATAWSDNLDKTWFEKTKLNQIITISGYLW